MCTAGDGSRARESTGYHGVLIYVENDIMKLVMVVELESTPL